MLRSSAPSVNAPTAPECNASEDQLPIWQASADHSVFDSTAAKAKGSSTHHRLHGDSACSPATPSAAAGGAGLRTSDRQMRKAQWSSLMHSRPDEAFDEPEAAAALAEAAATIGEFKLRSDPSFVPAEVRWSLLCVHTGLGMPIANSHQSRCRRLATSIKWSICSSERFDLQGTRMTPQRTLAQMVQLEQRMDQATAAFNGQLVALLAERCKLQSDLALEATRVHAICQALGQAGVTHWWLCKRVMQQHLCSNTCVPLNPTSNMYNGKASPLAIHIFTHKHDHACLLQIWSAS